jgi:hypothetical protein
MDAPTEKVRNFKDHWLSQNERIERDTPAIWKHYGMATGIL